MAFKAPIYWLKYTTAMIEQPTKTMCHKYLDPLIDLYHRENTSKVPVAVKPSQLISC